MDGQSTRTRSLKAGLVVVGATLLAILLPTAALSLNEAAYPDPPGLPQLDATTPSDALANADVALSWSEPEVVQFETVTFSATLIYGTEDDRDLPTVQVAYSNTASLTAETPEAFTISATSPSTMTLDTGVARPEGGYELTWTWDVVPLTVGPQKLFVHFVPEAFINGVRQDLNDRNAPVSVAVKVHPAQLEFQESVASAEGMEVSVPDDMTAGQDYDVSASFPLSDADVSADIDLAEGPDSVDLTIRETEVAALASATTGTDAVVTRRWVVTPAAAGQVSLVFTARLQGVAGTHALEDTVERTTAVQAESPAPPIWDVIGPPVTVLGSIIVVITGGITLWVTIRKMLARKSDDGDESDEDGAAGKTRTPADNAKDADP